VLPAADEATAVAHLGVPAHRAHPRILQRCDHPLDRVRFEYGVAVDQDKDVGMRLRDPAVERAWLP
jgi:hypothetical protein